MSEQFIPTAQSWLLENSNLSASQRNALAELCPVLIKALPVSATGGLPTLVSIAGPPGSGKSTLTKMLAAVLAASGRNCQLVSLDDYYLPRTQRQQLCTRVHPLCAVRGVPGTHDLPLLLSHLDLLLSGSAAQLSMPQFDKTTDDRRQQPLLCRFETALDYVLLEGWVCGMPPQSEAALLRPLNSLESSEDRDLLWRRWVNLNAQKYHQALEQRTNSRWYLRAPGWHSVIQWRWQQEQELAQPALKTRGDVESFLAHFHRLVEHMQDTAGNWADLIIPLNDAHCATIP